MFIREIKEYLLTKSSCFKKIEIKYITDLILDTKMAALSILVEDFNVNYRTKLIECIAEAIIEAFNKSGNYKCDLYLVTPVSPMYEETFDKVTARVCFSFKND